MDFSIDNWVNEVSSKIKKSFKERVVFIGLQGSYKRGEATVNSDIDVVIILDKISINDLKKYKNILESMDYHEKACGFISGKKEIENWPKWELFQFYNDTESIHGSLESLIPKIEEADIIDGIIANVSAIYHQACHSYLYSENKEVDISVLYKNTFFVLQSVYYIENGKYISSRSKLLSLLESSNREILYLTAPCFFNNF